MMVSADTLRRVFGRLRAANMHPPCDLGDRSEAGRRAIAELVDIWAEAWRDRSDDALLEACRAYIASGERWWPSPGQLLALAPARPARQLEARTPLERAEHRMGQVSAAAYEVDPSGTLSLQLLDQVLDAEDAPACGTAHCIGADCLPCTERRAAAFEQAWTEWQAQQRRAS